MLSKKIKEAYWEGYIKKQNDAIEICKECKYKKKVKELEKELYLCTPEIPQFQHGNYVSYADLVIKIVKLETREQKLIEKLEDRIKELKNKSGGNTYHVQSVINAEIRENERILKILKGEADE